jgi:hypothetical protein
MANERAEQADIEQANNAAQPEKAKPSKRRQHQLDRLQLIKENRMVPRVRVLPRDDKARKNIKHPRAGVFRSSGSMEWPNDTFTKRRLREGVVTLDQRSGEQRDQERQEQRSTSRASPRSPASATASRGSADPQRYGSAPTDTGR